MYISDCGFRIADFKKSRKQRLSCGSGFPVLSLSKGSRDLDYDCYAFNDFNDFNASNDLN